MKYRSPAHSFHTESGRADVRSVGREASVAAQGTQGTGEGGSRSVGTSPTDRGVEERRLTAGGNCFDAADVMSEGAVRDKGGRRSPVLRNDEPAPPLRIEGGLVPDAQGADVARLVTRDVHARLRATCASRAARRACDLSTQLVGYESSSSFAPTCAASESTSTSRRNASSLRGARLAREPVDRRKGRDHDTRAADDKLRAASLGRADALDRARPALRKGRPPRTEPGACKCDRLRENTIKCFLSARAGHGAC